MLSESLLPALGLSNRTTLVTFLQLLMNAGADVNHGSGKALLRATGDREILTLLLRGDASVKTLLHALVRALKLSNLGRKFDSL